MAPRSDNRSLYVLVASTLGAIFSLAAAWILVAHPITSMVA
jgi:hypothetical protein